MTMRRRFTPEQMKQRKEKVRKLYVSNSVSVKSIAEMFDISTETVYAWCRDILHSRTEKRKRVEYEGLEDC